MTREEAKELLLHILMTYEPKDQYGDYDDPEPYEQALTMAIEALSERNIAMDIATNLENEQDMRVILQNDAVNEDTQTERRVDHDRDWIIGCIKHDGFIKTDRFDKANQIILDALQFAEHFDLLKEHESLQEVVRKPIKGYEDYYEVDQFGRVFAKERMIHVTDHDREYDKHLPSRQMKQSVHTKGYKTVPLTKDGVCTTKFVHRIVAEAFIPNPDDLPFVNHIDEDKTNNFVENLEWCTEQYNSTYGKAREKHAKALKGRHHTEEHKKKISDSLKRFYGERREE